MSQKTEITFQIFQNINEIKKQLVSLGYEETEEFTGCDTYFTTLRSNEINSASYKDLLDSSIIIRSFKTKGKSELTNLMVFKNKILDNNNNVISEEKISTQISDLNSTKRILSAAKLNNWLTLKQQNAFYKLNNITITVGTVEGLNGSFMEIEEFDDIKHLTPQQKIEYLKQFAENLHFNMGSDFSVKKAYMLFQQNKKEQTKKAR